MSTNVNIIKPAKLRLPGIRCPVEAELRKSSSPNYAGGSDSNQNAKHKNENKLPDAVRLREGENFKKLFSQSTN